MLTLSDSLCNNAETLLTPKNFEKLIYEDSISEKTIFLVAEVEGKIVGVTCCKGSNLSRVRHKSAFGIQMILLI